MVFYIRKDRKTGGYVVVRVGADYDMHAHIKSMDGCHQLIRLIDKGLEPRSRWLREAARRLLHDDEFAQLKQPAQGHGHHSRALTAHYTKKGDAPMLRHGQSAVKTKAR